MRFLYYIALVLILLWLVGFLALDLGGLVHVLLVLAIISVLLRLIRGKRV